jgi:hypothetical protein
MNTIDLKENKNPKETASYLIQEHGIEGAIQEAMESVAAANSVGDYYSLSVWREIRTLLKAKVQEEPKHSSGTGANRL